jgi:flagellar biogenesis protein FliO
MTALPVDAAELGRATTALAIVLALLLGALWLVRRHGGGAFARFSPGGRIVVTASHAVDARVRLVLVRRDDAVEHLLAIGPGGVSVIESLPARSGAGAAPGAAA